jgi:hypothetical protein
MLAPGGYLVWHDYTHKVKGVHRYLNELSKSLPLQSISYTRLVVYQRPG